MIQTEHLQPQNGIEHISPELLPRLADLELFGFDMDDTLLQRDTGKLAVKLQHCVIWNDVRRVGEQPVDPSYAYSVFEASSDAWAADRQRIRAFAEAHFSNNPHSFYRAVANFCNGTENRAVRSQAIKDLGFPDEDAFWDVYREFGLIAEKDVHPSTYIKPAPGVVDLLTNLDRRGIPKHVISNSTNERIESRIQALQAVYRGGFASITSARDIGHKKPDPFAFNALSERLGLQPEGGRFKAIYFGNGDEDVLAANAAGWVPVIVNLGRRDFSHINDQPHIRVRTLKDFHGLWRQHAPKV